MTLFICIWSMIGDVLSCPVLMVNASFSLAKFLGSYAHWTRIWMVLAWFPCLYIIVLLLPIMWLSLFHTFLFAHIHLRAYFFCIVLYLFSSTMAVEIKIWMLIFALLVVSNIQLHVHGEPQVPCFFIFGDSLVDNCIFIWKKKNKKKNEWRKKKRKDNWLGFLGASSYS